MKVAIINSSSCYNLGAEKIARYHIDDDVYRGKKFDMFCMNVDRAYFSAVFTYDLPKLVQGVNLALARGIEVEVGGPAVTKLSDWVMKNCGIKPHIGLDERFEHMPGEYEWTFTSRGCPRNCSFCLVTALEGKKVIENDDFLPAPNIGDNNILMTSARHQENVVEREKQFSSVDINSGFDCRVFALNPDYYFNLWSQLPLRCWRFAFDSPEQEEPIKKVLKYLQGKGLDRHRVQVYVICNFNASPAEVRRRADIIKSYGMWPYLMIYRPVNTVEKGYISPRWTYHIISTMIGYYNQPSIWMSCSFTEYKRGLKEEEE